MLFRSEHDQLAFVFDRFKKLGNKHSDSFGLGLPIVKTIADFHRIEMKIESFPEQGTSFQLIFP